MAQVVEHLPSKFKALTSNTSTTKNVSKNHLMSLEGVIITSLSLLRTAAPIHPEDRGEQ
jgi:hypothetical protein